VNVVNKRVIGYLAEEAFTTMQALNTAIRARLVEINEPIPGPMASPGGNASPPMSPDCSRRCRPTSSTRWNGKQLKVGRNYHVSCDAQHYSVPYTPAPISSCGSGSPPRR
jgi:hypothetical protein